MDKFDMSSVIPLLRHFGIDLDKLDPDKLEKLMKLSNKFKDTSQNNCDAVSEMRNILGIGLQGPKKTKKTTSLKIGRNDPCPCESGKKWKKCCM